jgi:hypothetical protein
MSKEMSRREFIKGVAIGGAALYASEMFGNHSKGWAMEKRT